MKIIGLLLFCIVCSSSIAAENQTQEKKLTEVVEKFVVRNRKSDGDYTTISLRGWRSEMSMPALSNEDMIRKVLATFEDHYKNLRIVDYTLVYLGKTNGGLDYDFIIIHHQTEPVKTYRFATKNEVVEK
jgi:hypothetical protein